MACDEYTLSILFITTVDTRRIQQSQQTQVSQVLWISQDTAETMECTTIRYAWSDVDDNDWLCFVLLRCCW